MAAFTARASPRRAPNILGKPGGAPPVALHPLIASALLRIDRVPHRYGHLFMSYFADGVHGEAFSTDANRALETSLYEGLERWLGTFYEAQDLIAATPRALGSRAVDVRELVLPSDWELAGRGARGIRRFHDDLPLHWMTGWMLQPDGLHRTLFPAAMTCLRYGWRNPRERIAPLLSAGMAAGASYAAAILHALYELIERDAFMVAWLHELSAPAFAVRARDGGQMAILLKALKTDGFEVGFFNLTTDVPVTVSLCAITHPDLSGGAFAFGLGANLRPWQAIVRSLFESLEMLVNYHELSPRSLRARPWRRHKHGARLAASFERAAFLTKGGRTIAISETATPAAAPQTELSACLARVRTAGVKVGFVDLTPHQLRKSSFRLVRVHATKLQPQVYETDCWRLGHRRVFDAPAAMGLQPKGRTPQELNLSLHPLAATAGL